MKGRKGITLCVALLLLQAAGYAQTRPEPNAFLNKKVRNTQELVSQVKSDPAVMDRYERHYAMDSGDVLAYLGSLEPGVTAKDEVHTIYSVPEEGYVKARTDLVKKGTPVFVDDSGRAVLLLNCGNPLDRGPMQPEVFNDVTPVMNISVVEELREMEVAEVSPQQTFAEANPLEPASPVLLSEPEVVTPPVTEGESPIPIIPAAGAPNILPLFLGLLGVGAIGSGGGGSPPPIPEPATMIILGAGAAALVARRRRKA